MRAAASRLSPMTTWSSPPTMSRVGAATRPSASPGGRDERPGGSRAGPEEANGQRGRSVVGGEPVECGDQAPPQQVHVEAVLGGTFVTQRLVGRQQVHQQSPESAPAELLGDPAVAGAESAAAAAVREEDDP